MTLSRRWHLRVDSQVIWSMMRTERTDGSLEKGSLCCFYTSFSQLSEVKLIVVSGKTAGQLNEAAAAAWGSDSLQHSEYCLETEAFCKRMRFRHWENCRIILP